VQRTDWYAVVRLQENLQQAHPGGASVVFLGDSITDVWTTNGAASWSSQIAPLGAADFGIAGNTTENLLAQIAAGELAGQPKVVVLMIGTNDIMRRDTALQTEQGIAAVVATVRAYSPRSQVLLMGVLPMIGGTGNPLTQEAFAVNAMLAGLDDGTYVHFINTSSAYLLPDGSLNNAMFVDTVHPSALGYTVWADVIGGALDALTGHAAPAPLAPVTPAPLPVLPSHPAPVLLPHPAPVLLPSQVQVPVPLPKPVIFLGVLPQDTDASAALNLLDLAAGTGQKAHKGLALRS
jgi:lysophospholipase L1-like esterase